MNPRILIVDDHEIVREGIRTLLARSGKNWEVCGEACNASDAIVAIKSLHPRQAWCEKRPLQKTAATHR